MEPLTFDLIGADGRAHHYEVLPHNTEEGLPIVGRLMQAGIPAVVAAVGAFLGGGVELKTLGALAGPATTPEEKAAKARALLEIVGSLDLDAVLSKSAPLGDKLAAAIPQLDIARLGPELMRRATRDGAQLANPAEFNKAYKANYWELIAACQKVIAFNRFLPRLGS